MVLDKKIHLSLSLPRKDKELVLPHADGKPDAMGWNGLDRFAVGKVSGGFAQTICLHPEGTDKRLDVELFFQ